MSTLDNGYSFDAMKAASDCIHWVHEWFEENAKGKNVVVAISGGKDSTVAAGICAKALGKGRVIGLMLPDGMQHDIEDSQAVIKELGITGIEMNIGAITTLMHYNMKTIRYTNIHPDYLEKNNRLQVPLSEQARQNLPPRIRMAASYMVAQSQDAMVSNNSNLSERWIGYSTIYGDTAGDFAPLANLTKTEVVAVGRAIGIPEKFLVKPPSDGLCGSTDEDKLGFTYEMLDLYLRTGMIKDQYVKGLIDGMHKRTEYKRRLIASFEWGQIAV